MVEIALTFSTASTALVHMGTLVKLVESQYPDACCYSLASTMDFVWIDHQCSTSASAVPVGQVETAR